MTPDTADGLCWRLHTSVWSQHEVESGRIDERLHSVESMAHLVDQAHRSDSTDVEAIAGIGGRFVTVTSKRDQTVERAESTHGRDRTV